MSTGHSVFVFPAIKPSHVLEKKNRDGVLPWRPRSVAVATAIRRGADLKAVVRMTEASEKIDAGVGGEGIHMGKNRKAGVKLQTAVFGPPCQHMANQAYPSSPPC